MTFAYPEFHGRSGEDIVAFLEQMEVACISNHIVDQAQVLRLLEICVKGDARKWLEEFRGQQAAAVPPVAVTAELIKTNIRQRFRNVEDPEETWQKVKTIKQGETELVEHFVKRFNEVWEKLCVALAPEHPPAMMKKDSFVAGLKSTLGWRVELKKPATFDDAVQVAKNKEWKAGRLTQMGVGSSEDRLEIRRTVASPTTVRGILPVVAETQVVQPVVASGDEEMRNNVRQMVDLMKDLSLNMMNNTGTGGRGRGRGAGGGRGFYGGRRPPVTCYNCGGFLS